MKIFIRLLSVFIAAGTEILSNEPMNECIDKIAIRDRCSGTIHELNFFQYLFWSIQISYSSRLSLEVIFLSSYERHDLQINARSEVKVYLDKKGHERMVLKIVFHFFTKRFSTSSRENIWTK